jgi:hypothetical protein
MDHANGGVMLKITGTAFFTNGQSFTVAHDDGLTITVGGSTILSDGGPTSPVTTPYTYSGPTGNQSFEIDYGECCGAPAVLETTLVPARVPEPASIFLLGTLLCGVGTMVRRKFSNMS